MSRVRCIKVQLHGVVRTGENGLFRMVEELLREHRNFDHSTCACELRSQLVIVAYRVHGLEEPVIDGAAVLGHGLISEMWVVEQGHRGFGFSGR